MKIREVHITTLGMLRKHFRLEEVWENIENGMLLDCQKQLAGQHSYAAEKIAGLLEAYAQKDGLPEEISAFYRDGMWDLKGLERSMETLLPKSRDHSGNNFYSRNSSGMQKVIYEKGISWETETAALFYLFLLLMLQANPQGEISDDDFHFFCSILENIPVKKETAEVKNQNPRLYPCQSGVLFLKEGRIINGEGKLFSTQNERIGCYAYTQDLGLLAFTEQGAVSECTEPDTAYEIRSGLKERENQHVVMAAAYGDIYVLLLEDGTIFSNIKDSITAWKDLCWIGAGLNSITAIRGRNRCLLELGSDSRLDQFSDVRAVYTRSEEECCRYMVLKNSGVLIMDDGMSETDADAAYMDQEGYVYAVKTMIFFRKFDSKIKETFQLEPDAEYQVVELCKYRSAIYARAVFGGEEQLRKIEVSCTGVH